MAGTKINSTPYKSSPLILLRKTRLPVMITTETSLERAIRTYLKNHSFKPDRIVFDDDGVPTVFSHIRTVISPSKQKAKEKLTTIIRSMKDAWEDIRFRTILNKRKDGKKTIHLFANHFDFLPYLSDEDGKMRRFNVKKD